jgi:hypothetical protein
MYARSPPLASPVPSPAKSRACTAGDGGEVDSLRQTFVLRFDLSSLDAGYRVYVLPDWLPGMRLAAACTTTVSRQVVSLQCTFQLAGYTGKDAGYTLLVRRLNDCSCCARCPSRRVTAQATLRRKLDDGGGVAIPVTFSVVDEDEDGVDTTFSPKKLKAEPHPVAACLVPGRKRRLAWD